MWFVFALLSAVFAALTSILAKIGYKKNSVTQTCVAICVTRLKKLRSREEKRAFWENTKML